VVVTNRAADGSSITFLVGPGVSGTASVTKVSYTFAPAAPPVTLRTTTSLDVPGITTIPIVVNPSSPAAGAVATVTAANFKFLPTFSLTVGGVPAYVVSRSADSSSAQIVLPVGTGPVVVNGVALSFLTSVTLNGLTPVATVNAPTTRPYNGADPDASAATITAAAPGTEVVFYDTFTNGGPDLIGDGGPNRFYNLVVPSAGSRTIKVTWNTAADLDLFLIDAGFTSILASSAGTGNPETFTYNFPAAGSYLIGVVNYQSGPTPVFQISIK
jgi:hypothetical protein